MANNSEAFKKAYRNGKVWADADRAIALLEKEERIALYKAMEKVEEYMGLDMRQEFYLDIMRHYDV